MSNASETLVHVLTPAGRGAIALLRLSGPRALELAGACFRPRRASASLRHAATGRLLYGDWVDDGEVVDDVLVCRVDEAGFEVEVSCHGGPVVVRRVVASLTRRGAVASAGGGTSLAWSASTRIERLALDGLCAAKTERAVRFLLAQRSVLPRALDDALRRIREDDDIDASEAIRPLLAQTDAARRLLKGQSVVLAGPANAGKSTLFNALVGREAALTSPHPGTTLDWIEAEIEIAGFPVTLVDTAGFFDAPTALDAEGVRRAEESMLAADLVLLVIDGADPQRLARLDDLSIRLGGAPVEGVLNKCDLGNADHAVDADARLSRAARISATTGVGLDRLIASLSRRLGAAEFDETAPTVFDSTLAERLRELEAAPVQTLLDELRQRFF
ncbi:MAG: tRNA modification GTPase MnmE [Planctomycetota bacterium]|nr:MAG: tRNA modification GTPase MnmE [Planctomycetota bacterium]